MDATSALNLTFPSVTRWVTVTNLAANADLKLGFTANGVAGTNYVVVPANSILGPLELKVTQLHLTGGAAGSSSVAAGLTYISAGEINNPQMSPSGSNWSGSAAAVVG